MTRSDDQHEAVGSFGALYEQPSFFTSVILIDVNVLYPQHADCRPEPMTEPGRR